MVVIRANCFSKDFYGGKTIHFFVFSRPKNIVIFFKSLTVSDKTLLSIKIATHVYVIFLRTFLSFINPAELKKGL